MDATLLIKVQNIVLKVNFADFLTFSPCTVCGGAGICVLCANQLELEKFYLLD
jgi:hypothetical protein